MKIINSSGKRKTAIARATLKEGNGKVNVNNEMLENIEPSISRMKIKEPLILAGETAKKLDIDVDVKGGGYNAQAEAARVAISRALIKYDSKLERIFLDYNRSLLVSDVRRKECAKPNSRGRARAKRQKSYR
ncbi:30S ribosomal protein S9 [Candidatus Woesearchaeota archaeon]|nr:30S ribosomal protein S9 [Candidatus Woesearchaeota archaeon]